MAIDLTNQEKIRKLKRDDLIADAVERKDKTALRWLEDEFFKQVPVKDKDGKDTDAMKPKPLITIRSEYLVKFLGYKPTVNYFKVAREKKKAEREKALRNAFEEAFRKINQ